MRKWLFAGILGLGSLLGQQADTIFFGGDIITVNDRQPEAEAVAVKDGKIVYVGDKKGAFDWKGENTNLVDLQGKTLLPGFINPHTHITLDAIVSASTDVSPFKYKTIKEVIEVLKEAVKKGPVLAWGYDPSLMSDPGELNFETLDAISKDTPIVVVNKSGHIAYGNRKAFEIAKVTDQTPNPVGGSYQRDKEGHLTGVGYEVPAVGRLVSAVNNLSTDELSKLTRQALKVFADAGYTTVTDLALGLPVPTPEEHIKLLRDASVGPDASVRIQGYMVTNLLDKIPDLRKQNTDMFKILGLKIWADGSIQGYTAAMKEDYKDQETKGKLNFTQDQLTEIVKNARKQGIQVAVHANGDQAVEDTLQAFEKAQEAYPSDDARFRIEHASIVDPGQSYCQTEGNAFIYRVSCLLLGRRVSG